MRKPSYRPRLDRLEDHVLPGSMLTGALQPLGFLGLDATLSDQSGLTGLTAPGQPAVLADGITSAPSAPVAPANAAPLPASSAAPLTAPLAPDLGTGTLAAPLGGSTNPVNADLLTAVLPHQQGGGGGGINPQDDVVSVGALPGSYFLEGTNGTPATFGEDPPMYPYLYTGVNITDAGTFDVSSSDIYIPTIYANLAGLYVSTQPQLLTDVTGTYDRTTGISTATFTMQLYIDSNQPNFNHQNCIVPPTTINLSTEDPSGTGIRFLDGLGTIVDSQFGLQAIPNHSCGSFFGIDYTGEINFALGLPSPAGTNNLTINMVMDPALPPFSH
jgi:hypothetical protein